MTTLREMEPRVEVYSIDEAFVSLAGSDTCAGAEQAARIRERIARHVGITVSIGIGPSKTLAKIANRIAKKEACRRGIFVFPAEPDRGDMLLADLDVGEVWGIGRHSRAKLARHGITTALQLKKADQQWLGKQLTVTGARTALELAGISCINLEQAPPAADQYSARAPLKDRCAAWWSSKRRWPPIRPGPQSSCGARNLPAAPCRSLSPPAALPRISLPMPTAGPSPCR